MLKKSLFLPFTAALCAGALTILTSPTLRASDDDGVRGGDIEGTIELDLTRKLDTTDDTPAGASGEATLVAKNLNDVESGEIRLKILGLPDGTYSVAAVLLSDDTDEDLGEITSVGGVAEVKFGPGGVALPEELALLDVAGLQISDEDLFDVFTADFLHYTRSRPCTYKVAIAGTGGSTGVSGDFERTIVNIPRGKNQSTLRLNVDGLAARTHYILLINEEDEVIVRTNRRGQIRSRRLPINTLAVHRIEVLDEEFFFSKLSFNF